LRESGRREAANKKRITEKNVTGERMEAGAF
jgi:hypothetical protein